jgi:hypothetical protein
MSSRHIFQKIALVVFLGWAGIGSSHASLVGPWFRYDCTELGFQIPVSSGWDAIPVPEGMVFAIQSMPNPYVRVAVGRMKMTDSALEPMIQEELRTALSDARRKSLKVDGQDAVSVEGMRKDGGFIDYFVKKEPYWYWIGFSADNKEQWPQYIKTFDIVVDGFHFL